MNKLMNKTAIPFFSNKAQTAKLSACSCGLLLLLLCSYSQAEPGQTKAAKSKPILTKSAPAYRHIHEGGFTLEKLEQLFIVIRDNPGINEIEFVNSPGASQLGPWLYYHYLRIINDHKLTTYARGHCASLCASLFLMGHKKYLLPAKNDGRTFLLLHPVFDEGTDNIALPASKDVFANMAARNPWIAEQDFQIIYSVPDKSGGILILRDQRDGKFTYFQQKYGAKWQPFNHYTLEQLNIGLANE